MADQYTAIADGVATGTALKTILAIATTTSPRATILEWGISFDGIIASAVPVECRLQRQSSAGTGGAALTALYGPNPHTTGAPTATVTALKGAAGTWAVEPTAGAIVRAVKVPPTSAFVQQFPLGQSPIVPVSSWLAVVVTAAATVNATAWIVWEE